MRKIKFNDYIKKRSEFGEIRARLDLKREPSFRVRDEKEHYFLLQLDKARWEKWQKEGKLQIIGSRKYRLDLTFES